MDLYRADGVLDLNRIQATKIMIVGLGSLGSLAVSSLVYPWREIVLVEPEDLEIQNIERHLLGRSAIGRNKAEGVHEFLIDKGLAPESIVVEPSFVEPVLDKHADADLVLVAIDRPASCIAINYWAMKHGIPVLYGGIYPKGTGSDIYVIPKPREICYQCAAIKMGSMEAKPTTLRQVNYGVAPSDLEDEGVVKAVPALHNAVANTAVQMAIFALDLVSGVEVPSQVFVMGNTWEPVIKLGDSHLRDMSCIISKQVEMGINPMWRLRVIGGQYVLAINRTNLPLTLDRHNSCPNHDGTLVSVEDI